MFVSEFVAFLVIVFLAFAGGLALGANQARTQARLRQEARLNRMKILANAYGFEFDEKFVGKTDVIFEELLKMIRLNRELRVGATPRARGRCQEVTFTGSLAS